MSLRVDRGVILGAPIILNLLPRAVNELVQHLRGVLVALVAGLLQQLETPRLLATHVAAEVQGDRERPRVHLWILERRLIVDGVGVDERVALANPQGVAMEISD